MFLNRDFREDIPEEALSGVFMEVFGAKTLPDRALEKSEYDAMLNKLEALGPWPSIRTVQLGIRTIRCRFDANGVLEMAEKSEDDGRTFTSILGVLDEEDPFRFQWVIEE